MNAKEIKALRAKLPGTRQDGAMNQKDLADHIGVDVQTVQAWEQGRKRPSRLARRALNRLALKAKRMEVRT